MYAIENSKAYQGLSYMRKLFFICLICASYSGKSQTSNDFAESFYFFPKNSFALIPAYTGIGTDFQANLIYQSYFGQLSAIRTYMADFGLNLQSKKFPEANKHYVGGGLYNEREGDFFNRYRAMVHYSWHIRLSDKYNLSGGTSVHLLNYLFKSSSAGSQGSDFNWSGNIGASVYSSDFRLGFSVNDFNKPRLQPIDFEFIILPYYMIHAEKKKELINNVEITGSIRANIIPAGYSTGSANLGVVLGKKVGVHGFFHNRQGWGLAFNLERIEIDNTWLDFSFAYKAPNANGGRPLFSIYEINIGYNFLRK